MSCIDMSLQRQKSIQENSLDHWVSDIPLVQERDKHAVWLLALLQLLAFRQQNTLLGADEIFRTSVNWNKHPPQDKLYTFKPVINAVFAGPSNTFFLPSCGPIDISETSVSITS